ncbi:MAG: nucleoside-diphosphate kinase [Actinomycetota bacterium]|nr:nucleoside-diphosphate kinase [Actinomycetota bacterium]
MGFEKTLLIVKPDGVARGLVGEVLSRIEQKGLRIEKMKTIQMDMKLAESHYIEHKGKPYYDELIKYITEAPVVVAIIGGENAIASVRRIMGPTDPLEATPGSIRGAYATSTTRNLVHGSDSQEAAKREIELFFPESKE